MYCLAIKIKYYVFYESIFRKCLFNCYLTYQRIFINYFNLISFYRNFDFVHFLEDFFPIYFNFFIDL
jgi:hypothetical protein